MQQEEIIDDVAEQMIEKILIQQLIQFDLDIQKIKNFLKMCIYRRRYKSKRNTIIKV